MNRLADAAGEWSERLRWLRKTLVELDAELASLRRHADVFELQLKYMYTRFVRVGTAFLGPATTGPGLAAADNLDSGNAVAAPPRRLVDTLSAALNRPADLRIYSGPEASSDLAAAAAGYWNHLLRPARPVLASEITVGAGTVNLWDGVVRQFLRPVDTVLVATPTYGFFLPHVTRAGGGLAGLPVRGGLYDAETLTVVVRDLNAAGRARWRARGGPERMREALATRFGSAAAPLVETVYNDIARSPRVVAALLQRCAQERGIYADVHWLDALVARHGPPRVSMLLHLNPTLSGAVHPADATLELARAATALELRVVEDLSYFPVRCAGRGVVSIREFLPGAICLLGVSKVLGIADLRIGLAVSNEEDSAALMRRVENSVGFVPRFVQCGLAEQLADLDGTDRFIAAADDRYDAALRVLLQCIGGAAPWPRDIAVDDAAMTTTRELVRSCVARIDGDRSDVEGLADRFLDGGLAELLPLDSFPTAGFFALLDCSAALAAFRAAGIPEVRDAFGLAAFLAHLVGVRVIAAEAADVDWSGAPPLLRISFSVEQETLVTALFYTYVALSRIAAGEVDAP